MKTNKYTLENGTIFDYKWHMAYNCMGFRTGYIRIPEGHPWHRRVDLWTGVNVHGGITFQQMVDGEFWIGFDCGHAGDAPDPELADLKNEDLFSMFSSKTDTVRDSDYVKKEIAMLVKQAAEEETISSLKKLKAWRDSLPFKAMVEGGVGGRDYAFFRSSDKYITIMVKKGRVWGKCTDEFPMEFDGKKHLDCNTRYKEFADLYAAYDWLQALMRL